MTEKDNYNETTNGILSNQLLSQECEAMKGEHDSGSSRVEHHRFRGSHRHHHSHRRRKKKPTKRRNEKIKKFIKYNKHYLVYAGLTIIFVVLLAVLGSQLDKQQGQISPESSQEDSSVIEMPEGVDQIQITVPLFTGEIDIISPVIDAFMDLESNTPIEQFYDKYSSPDTRLDISLPVELEYEVSGLPNRTSVQTVEVVVADNENFAQPQVVRTKGYTGKAKFYNLKTGTEYHYKVIFMFSNGATTSVNGTFKTRKGPRILMIDGVRNTRDFGGWTTLDGNVVKQGLLYRGQEIDGAVEPNYLITADGLNTMLSVLGIKMDMDLRLPSDNAYGTDALGPGVKHMYYSAPMYSNIFNSMENCERIRQIFSDLANEENYPIYMHCTYGQDRTGTVCYLLGALLGVDAPSLAKDYQLSGLCYGSVSTEAFENFVVQVRELPGYNLSEKVEKYLLSIGVTPEEIASIRTIFLG